MREVTSHRSGLNELNNLIRIEVADDPSPGGASTKYQFFARAGNEWHKQGRVEFQGKPLFTKDDRGNQTQINQIEGVTNEVLLAVVLDRLKSFNKGKFPCCENTIALQKIEEALQWLFARTRDRVNRGVEGSLVE